MKKLSELTKDTQTRILSYILAAIGVLAGYTAVGFSQAEAYRMQIEYNYERALDELSDSVGNIDIALQKSLYAGSSNQFNSMATKLWVESANAKNSLGQLPTGDNGLISVNKFISQVGDFALAISNKNALDEDITPEEIENLKKLWQYASALKTSLNSMQAEFEQGRLWAGEIERLIEQGENITPQNQNVTDGFREMEEGFTDYPTLIYDGPFSDHLMERKPLLTGNMEEIPEAEAKKTASKFLGCDESLLESEAGTQGNMPCYGFLNRDSGASILITRKGGIVSSFINGRYVEEKKLTNSQAVEKAKAFLTEKGYTSIKQSYYETTENICTVNFASEVQNVTIYTELIKISVAMDTGEVLMMDAKNYIMNHKPQTDLVPKASVSQAQAIVSKNLTVKSSSLAIIPSQGKYERLCYEFLCTGQNGEKVLVYVNADNLIEEQILILLESDDGVLTM